MKNNYANKIADYVDEFNRWLNVLQKYHTNRFTANYRQYTAYGTTEGTETKISDPVASELVERVVQRFFERQPKFFVTGRGINLPKEITDTISGIASYIWSNPDTVQASGVMRSKLKMVGREFCVIGNVGVETFYNNQTETPDFRLIPIEDIIFDPAKTLKTSSVYYVRNFVSLEYLKKEAETTKDGKVYGLFKNIPKLEELLKENKVTEKQDSTENRINRSGSDLYDKTTDKIEIITRYKGKELCRFVKDLGKEGDKFLVLQEYTNDILEDDPLDFAMDIEVPKEPYAFSLIDYIKGPLYAKDLFLNQMIDYGSKVLNPPLFVDSNLSPQNKASLGNAWKLGGIVWANKDQAEHKPMPPLGSFGFDMLNYLQQRAESSVGVGSYLGGVPNQENDKTRGTKGGIEMLLNQAISPLKDRQQNIEESIIEPVINKCLKMYAMTMGKNEVKDIMITGQTPKWIKATRGLLMGKITIYDLFDAELMTQDEVMEMEAIMRADGKDPEKELQIDTDWIVRVEAGSTAEVDTEKELNNFERWVMFNKNIGRQQDLNKISNEMAYKIGVKEPEQYDLPAGKMPMIGAQTQGEPMIPPMAPTLQGAK